MMLRKDRRNGQYKIFDSIIESISISVMYYFVLFQKSTEKFFHNKTMFSDISPSICKRMIRTMNQTITAIINCLFVLIRIAFSTVSSSFLFLLRFWSHLRMRGFIKTITRTIINLIPLTFLSIKINSTIHTFDITTIFSRHNNLQIKKALSGGLRETVMFQHLLRALLDKKNLFPLSKASIPYSLQGVKA